MFYFQLAPLEAIPWRLDLPSLFLYTRKKLRRWRDSVLHDLHESLKERATSELYLDLLPFTGKIFNTFFCPSNEHQRKISQHNKYLSNLRCYSPSTNVFPSSCLRLIWYVYIRGFSLPGENSILQDHIDLISIEVLQRQKTEQQQEKKEVPDSLPSTTETNEIAYMSKYLIPLGTLAVCLIGSLAYWKWK